MLRLSWINLFKNEHSVEFSGGNIRRLLLEERLRRD